MKKLILTVVASLGLMFALANLAPSLLQDTSLSWMKLDRLSLRHNFYFGKGQWLADSRTLLAAIRFLYRVNTSDARPRAEDSQIRVVNFPVLPARQPRFSTNLFVTDETEPAIRLHIPRPSRCENLIVRKRMMPSNRPAPVFSAADLSSDG
jgi:hypothetical protein